nr:transcription-repair coupling factor [Corynebacterium mendelii]
MSDQFDRVRAAMGQPDVHVTAIDQLRPWLVSVMAATRPVLVVVPTGREAEDIAAELAACLGEEAVGVFTSWETLPHERMSPSTETVAQRAKVLDHIDRLPVVVAAARAFCQPIPVTVQGRQPVVLRTGEDHDFDELVRSLVFRGYQTTDQVGAKGQVAVRGGLIDVFPPTEEHPVRIDFWGDEIQEMKYFSVGDQRTFDDGRTDEVALYPCRELPVSDEVIRRAQALAEEHTGNAALQQLLSTVAEGQPADGMEALIPVLTDSRLATLAEFMPEGTHVLAVDPVKIHNRVVDLEATDREFLQAGWEAAAMGASGPISAEGLDLSASSYCPPGKLKAAATAAGCVWWSLAPTGMLGQATAGGTTTIELSCGPGPRPAGDRQAVETMYRELKEHVLAGGMAAFVSPNKAFAARMTDRFLDQGISAAAADGHPPQPGQVAVYTALTHGGLTVPGIPDCGGRDLVVITETDVTGNRVGDIAGMRRKRAKKRRRIDPLALEKGDYVVHDSHGIGRFVEMTERTITTGDETSRREYLVIEYAASKRGQPADRLYVPMDSLDLLSRYVGGEKPTLSKMGGSDWKNTKKKARSAVKEIAAELIELYAKRQAAPGHAFAADSPWQRELEDNFPYLETEDQMAAIDDVKADMEKPVPMDRVVVGDVGYGKTEVAVRAAFKAVQDGKQVAVLVPTTLLAQQHLATFTGRMDGFPVTIDCLSRFTSGKESTRILTGLADGSVDIVIGTHRLIQTGVRWKNLGLVIVDEEQRFGVEHKEHIKALRSHVDVLTMSATPIPRTLEMSMAGIREMSTILTPPQDRHPVLTYVGAQEDKQVAAAIRRELLRDGQVFYVHNRVQSIDERARHLRELVPEARIVVAHGQMGEEQLEKTVQGFWDKDYDVLVCTTIVETGLDIANANTLIVENAHHMGLSQLHQLRGRVGRSRQRGYAYFLYPKNQLLSETSYDRLATIAQNNELGAGMAVAMKDLEMRGAGNVLGAEQSGHIAGVGFDMYIRLVGEAVEAMKSLADGTPLDATDKGPKEIRVDLPVDAHVPESYIASERLRLEVYRAVAEAHNEQDLRLAVEDMKDRYGPVPVEVERLLSLARLRQQARAAGLTDLVVQGTRIKIHPVELADSKQVRLKRLYPGSTYRAAAKAIQLSIPKSGRSLTDPKLRDTDLVQWLADVISSLFDVPAIDVTGGKKSAPASSTPAGGGYISAG